MRTRAARRLPSLVDVHPSPFSAVLGCRLQSWDADEHLRERTHASPATRLKVRRKSIASRTTCATASGSSPLTWKIGIWSIFATSLAYVLDFVCEGDVVNPT